jgi:ClpP class serine protease
MKLKMLPAEFASQKREGEDVSGGAVELPSMEIVRGIAHIPFAGVLIKGATKFEKGSGALSHDDIANDIAEAIENPEVKGLFFDVDSPGGTSAGTPELADLILAAGEIKPTMAWVERLCCSAALWCMSGCKMMYGQKSSQIGAVECYCAWLDESEAMKRDGLRVELVKNTGGDFVAMGMPGHPLTEKQRAEMQEHVDDIYRQYVSFLNDTRPQIKPESMKGQTFRGEKAIAAGMLDALTTKQQAFMDLSEWAGV